MKTWIRGEGFYDRLASNTICCLIILLLLPVLSHASDFTAKSLGDHGNVTVMEVTGNYDAKNPDGSTNSDPRQAISKEFFRTHKDDYDFLVIFSNFDFKMPGNEAKAFYLHAKNDTHGIGQELFDYSGLFGSNGKLQGTIDMGNIANLATEPIDPKFEATLDLLGHEMLHRWAAYVKFRDGRGNISPALLGKDGRHWSFLLDTQASLLYGSRWQDNGNGTFTSIAARKYYSQLDLYLMGFIDKSQVPPMLLIENPDIDPAKLPETGVTISGIPHYVSIGDILAAEGERIPGVLGSQKDFRMAFIFITSPGTFTGDELSGLENIRDGWITRYSILTDGKGIIRIASILSDEVPSNPGITSPATTQRTLPPSINEGLAWLINAQKTDGSWADLSQTAERDTAETVTVLKEFETAIERYLTGLQWLKSVAPENTDFLARKMEASLAAGDDVATLTGQLLFMQNADGGWGSGPGLVSNLTDTAIVLKALARAGYSGQEVSKAIQYLASQQNTDHGWGNDDGSSRVETTSNVLSAFNTFKGSYQVDGLIASGADWLAGKQNPDGGFGNSPSTVYSTATAVLTLSELGARGDVTNNALSYILSSQAGDGSWNGSVYQTALAVNAVMKASVDPDLSIKQSDITFTPSAITTLPSGVVVVATINNFGQTAVPSAKVALFDGDPSLRRKIGEQTAAFPGQTATAVTFSIAINDGNRHVFYLSVDPEGLVAESNKNNNTAFNILEPQPAYDFTITDAGLTFSQNPVEIFKDVRITSKIENHGTMNAYNVHVRYYIDQPGEPFEVAAATVDIPAGSLITNEVTWRANKAGADLPVTVQIDPFNAFTETSKDNNKATGLLTVNNVSYTDPNLIISYKEMDVTPNPVNQSGSVHISAVVRNEGFSQAVNIPVSFFRGTPGVDGMLLGTATIPSLNPGESAQVSTDWTNINESGEKVIYVKVDPDGLMQEITKEDNDAFVVLNILSLPDLVVAAPSIYFNPPAPKIGDAVTIHVIVQNKGDQTASNIVARAFEGDTVIGSQLVPLLSGNSQTSVSFAYDTTGKNGAHAIKIVIDPDNQIIELSKDNNVASKTFGVQDANLWLTEQYISPNGDGVKDSTQFFFRLDNLQTVKVVVMDKKGIVVRTFDEGNFVGTSAGSVTWDGINDNGMVVPDGQYHIQIINTESKLLGSLLVIVDNNLSPWRDAIGTKYLFKRPVGGGQWMNDESGFLQIGGYNPYISSISIISLNGETIFNRSAYTSSGVYFSSLDQSPDGLALSYVASWPDYAYYHSSHFRIDRMRYNYDPYGWWGKYEYTAVRKKWSHDSSSVAVRSMDEPSTCIERLKIYNNVIDGKEDIPVFEREFNAGRCPGSFVYPESFNMEWSPDDSKLAYYDFGSRQLMVINAGTGSGTPMPQPGTPFFWIDNNRFLTSSGMIIVNAEDGSQSTLPGSATALILSPDRKKLLVNEGNNSFALLDAGSPDLSVLNRFSVAGYDGRATFSRDSRYVSIGKIIFDSEINQMISPGNDLIAFGGWLGDDSVVFKSTTGDLKLYGLTSDDAALLVAANTGDISVSPKGNYLTWSEGNSWYTADSLLNLKTNLYATKSENLVVLRGNAADLNFEGWKLEYRKLNEISDWLPIVPHSDTQVVDDIFSDWLPPYDGLYSVRLTAWDKAGNASKKDITVSWGDSAGITNIYKSTDSFSPNGDGVKDTVSLNYTVVSPIHLEFNILDGNNNLLRTYLRDYPGPSADSLVWDGRDNAGNIVPDGTYKITFFDFEFIVEVDTSYPQLGLHLSGPQQDYDGATQKGTLEISAILLGYALDNSLKSWTIEYGDGENPDQWYTLLSGSDLLIAHDKNGTALINPITDAMVSEFRDADMELLVGRKLRITAEDMAGNKSSIITGFLEERLLINTVGSTPFIISSPSVPELLGSGIHLLRGFETIKLPVESMNIQYLKDRRWIDMPQVITPESGAIHLEWDNTALETVNAVRVKAVDIVGHEYYSNTLPIQEIFWANGCTLTAKNSLFEDLKLLRLQLNSSDYKVFDLSKGDDIPTGDFTLRPIPEYKNGDVVRMIGIGLSGKRYETAANLGCSSSVELALSVGYVDADCGKLSDGKATLSARILGALDNSLTLKNLAYYLQKPDGLQLLKEIDLTKKGIDSATINTLSLTEGNYPVKAGLSYFDGNNNTLREITATDTLIVDRVLPVAQITYPDKAINICPIRVPGAEGDWSGISVEGKAIDNTKVKDYKLYYGIGGDPDLWQAAMTQVNGKIFAIEKNSGATGTLGIWNVTGLQETDYSLKLKVVDIAGNTSCYMTNFSVNKSVEISNLKKDLNIISPNADGIRDGLIVTYFIDRDAAIDAGVFEASIGIDGRPVIGTNQVRRLLSGFRQAAGQGALAWDGLGDDGMTLGDGVYGIKISAEDTCGIRTAKWTSIIIDNSPPATVITHPTSGDILSNIVEINGSADDPNFKSYRLEVGQGDNPPQWQDISFGVAPVKDGVLGAWNTFGLDGRYTLRLTAEDIAGNKSSFLVVVNLPTRNNLISEFSLSPRLISPNGDGKLDSMTISYATTDLCSIQMEMIDAAGFVRRTYSTGGLSAGIYSYSWEGTDASGATVPDGSYSVKLTAKSVSNPLITQGEIAAAAVDSTPPLIDIRQPLPDSFMKNGPVVTWTIIDQNMKEHLITYAGSKGEVALEHSNVNRENYAFGVLDDLPEGHYILNVTATDLAENVTEKKIAFNIDRTPPRVAILSPVDRAYFGANRNAVDIAGSILEENLASFSLRFGAGENPTQWTELLAGTMPPAASQLYSLKVGPNDGVPDGFYVLSLLASDKAGNTSETRAAMIVDNTPPMAVITSPHDGDYIGTSVDIRGTVSDQNLDRYRLEMSTGGCMTASKWTSMKVSSSSVPDGALFSLSQLPSDGGYCLRLTATDKSGNETQSLVNLIIDTQPPSAPLLAGNVDNKSNSVLQWSGNKERDISGYNIYRNGLKINKGLIIPQTYSDENLNDGVYIYKVTAVDLSGLESPYSNEIELKIDTVGPDIKINLPLQGASVKDVVEIKGTAYSVKDFKLYRVFVGSGQSPVSWSLLRISSSPVSNGLLAQWDTQGFSEGVYSLKLVAEDVSGNVTVYVTTVTVDNTPPATPVLISARLEYNSPPNEEEGAPATLNVVLTWQGNIEPDLAGYLLFKNDQIINAQNTAIGDLSSYLLSDTTYVERATADGRFNYYLIAMDRAGNLSNQSNAITVDIDTHPPHVSIVDPKNGAKFQNKISVKAETADLDIAAVQFQYKRADEAIWTNLGDPATRSPYIIFIDPASLGISYGNYNLRALSADKGGKTDPAPGVISVIYTDLTAPVAPNDFKAVTNGQNVMLSWSANTETDLKGYNIYRTLGGTRSKINSSITKDTTYQDMNLADGLYTYEVTALDTFGNESKPSVSSMANVYAPAIEQPVALTSNKTITIKGKKVSASSIVELMARNTSGLQASATVSADDDGNFAANLELFAGENRITAKAKDGPGNISKESNMVVVVYNDPPASPTGLSASVNGHNVSLSWTQNSEADLAGYNIYRDGFKLNAPVAISTGIATASSSYYWPPTAAFDGDTNTYWMYYAGYGTFNPGWWQIELPSAQLISGLKIYWMAQFSAKEYEVQFWTGYAWITQVRVTGNSLNLNSLDFTPSYRTDKIRLYITDSNNTSSYRYAGITDVVVLTDNVIAQASYQEIDMDDGKYAYKVAAVDYYGFESAPSEEVEAMVGDLNPPSAPQGLDIQVSGSSAVLRWMPNVESDLAGYNVYVNSGQGWRKVNSSSLNTNTFTHAGLINGTYVYRVTAIDAVGNESQPSDEALVTINADIPEPPQNLKTTASPDGRTLYIFWEYPGDSVAGFNLYRRVTAGGSYSKVNPVPLTQHSYTDTGLTNGTLYYYVASALDAIGNEGPYSNEAIGKPMDTTAPSAPLIFFPAIPGNPVVLYTNKTNVSGSAEPGATVELFRDGVSVAKMSALDTDTITNIVNGVASDFSLSPDGRTLAYSYNGSIMLRDVSTGTTKQIISQGFNVLWSPDGSRLAYIVRDANGINNIYVYELSTGNSVPLTGDYQSQESDPSWSSDGSRIAFVSNRGGSIDVWLKDIVSGLLTKITNGTIPSYPRLSPDGSKLSYFIGSSLYISDVDGVGPVLVDDNANRQSLSDWSRDGKKLAFVSYKSGYGEIYLFDIEEQHNVRITDFNTNNISVGWPVWSPDGSMIIFDKKDSLKRIESIEAIPAVELSLSSPLKENVSLRYLSRLGGGAIVYQDINTLGTMYLKGYFNFDDVDLDEGENIFTATASDSSSNKSASSEEIYVYSDQGLLPDLEVTQGDIITYPPFPQKGEQVLISVNIRNKGASTAKDVPVDVYLLESTGDINLLHSGTLQLIPAGDEEIIQFNWKGSSLSGNNHIIVFVDPDAKIMEADRSNNYAVKELVVVTDERIIMTTDLDFDSYETNRDVAININIKNPGADKTALLSAFIADDKGSVIADLGSLNANLSYGLSIDFPFQWNTGATYPGAYTVHSVLKDDSTVLAESTAVFTILPEIAIESVIVTDKAAYGPYEQVSASVSIKNGGASYIIPRLLLKTRVTDSLGKALFSEDSSITNLLPGSTGTFTLSWDTALNQPGDYSATVETYIDERLISTKSATFRISAVTTISGTISATLPEVLVGGTAQLDYVLHNSGNTAIDGLPFTLLIVDPETQTTIYSHADIAVLPVDGTKSEKTSVSTQGFGLKTYTVFLQYVHQGDSKTVATCSMTIKDGIAPVVSVVSPVSGSAYDSGVPIEVKASDDSSGVESVEYQIDDRGWHFLQLIDGASGKYATTWNPQNSDSGTHTISFRATDRKGNISSTVSVGLTVIVDNIAPVTVIMAPSNGSTLMTTTVTVSGTAADIGSSIRKVEVSTDRGVTWTAATGATSWSYEWDVPADGNYTVMSRATDSAGNTETPTGGVTITVYRRQASDVTTSGRQLMINGSPFLMKGVVYSPAPIGDDPETIAPYGDYFTLDYNAVYNRDLPLLRQMGANTVRLLTWNGTTDHHDFLDSAFNGGSNPIFVIAGYSIDPGLDIDPNSSNNVRQLLKDDFRAMVATHKNHPSILMWTIGNDLNDSSMYGDNAANLFSLINEMAMAAHAEEGDAYHPVVTALADRNLISTISAYEAAVPSLDAWGANVYRGDTFGTLFSEYTAASSRPLAILEYGIDAYDDVNGDEYENIGAPNQATYAESLWNEIKSNSDVCIGGSIMEYSDEWWKGKHSLDKACPDNNPALHSTCGYSQAYSPDGYSNEEWWGIMRTNRTGTEGILEPRVIYYTLQELWTESANAPAIHVAPGIADFGTLAAGSSQNITFSISNEGSDNLTVGSITLSGSNSSEFSKQQDHCSGHTLIPNKTCSLQIVYAPFTAGVKTATLLVSSNDPNLPNAIIALNAAATASISGKATSGGAPLSGVLVTLGGPAQKNLTTDNSGSFVFEGLLNGSYTVTLGKTGYTFTPQSATMNLGGNAMDVNFAGAINAYTVAPSSGVGGSISPSIPQTVNYNGTAAFTVTATTGYNIAAVTGCGGTLSGNIYNTGQITKDCVVTASFVQKTFTITASFGTNGNITPSGIVTVKYGENRTFSVMPDTGYHIADVTVDGISQGAISSYTFTNITENHTISVLFAATKPAMKFSVFGASGITISGGYVDSYNSSAGPYSGYHGTNGPVGTNSTLKGSVSLSGGAIIYGDAWIGVGGDPAKAITLSGGAVINGYRKVLSSAIDMTPPIDPGGGTSATFTNGSILGSGTYRISSVNLSGSGIGTISGKVTMYITGNLNISGSAKIVILPGGSLTVYVSGGMNVSGGGIVNETLNPHALTIYGTSSCTSVNYSGSSALYGVIYAPKAKITLSGGSGVYGSIIGNTVNISGGGAVHYDESL